MPVNINNREPLDETRDRALLEGLQGNILKGHGRDFAKYLILSLPGDSSRAKQLVGVLASTYVKSAATQFDEAAEFRKSQSPGAPFGCLLLSAEGYRRMGFDPAKLALRQPADEFIQSNFVDGMQKYGESDFHDPPPDKLEVEYRDSTRIHVLLLLADDILKRLSDSLKDAIGLVVDSGGEVVKVEHGYVLRNDAKDGIEHFGFVDGISQPLFLKGDFQYDGSGGRVKTKSGNSIERWDPFASLGLVLRNDPMTAVPDSFGSYAVYRKLEQNVQAFLAREKELADQLELEGRARELAGALAVGRFRDGTPVALSDKSGELPGIENNFTYGNLGNGGDDTSGLRCPFQAHIRKTNPRGDTVGTDAMDAEKIRRIARRGITYGDPQKPSRATQQQEAAPNPEGAGVLFLCFQSYIPGQFAFMQKAWCNRQSFFESGTGPDALIGQSVQHWEAPQPWPRAYGKPGARRFNFSDMVQLKGGEFFFAPSIAFLKECGSQ